MDSKLWTGPQTSIPTPSKCPTSPLQASDKCEGPMTLLIFLGFLLDSLSMPKDKLNCIARLVTTRLSQKACNQHELGFLIGQLQHASAVWSGMHGHSFLRLVIVLAKARNSQLMCLNRSFHSDLMQWHIFLRDWNDISMLSSWALMAHGGVVAGLLGVWWPGS